MKGGQTMTHELTTGEVERIAIYLGAQWGLESEEEVARIRESLKGTVIRGYISDGPSYTGPVFFVLFGGGPEFHYVLILNKHDNFEIVERKFLTDQPDILQEVF
jgi:hypothetical protein